MAGALNRHAIAQFGKPMRRAVRRCAVLLIVAFEGMASAARGHDSYPAVVTQVVDGDTVQARSADGRDLTVRLIGIDAPEPVQLSAPAPAGALTLLDDP